MAVGGLESYRFMARLCILAFLSGGLVWPRLNSSRGDGVIVVRLWKERYKRIFEQKFIAVSELLTSVEELWRCVFAVSWRWKK